MEGRLQRTVYADSSFLSVIYDTVDGKQRAIVTNHGITTFTYDPVSGNLKQIIGASGDTLLYAYVGSLLLSEESRGEVRGSVGFTYDNSFRVVKETVNGTDSVRITYDKDDNLMRVGAYAVKRNTLNGMLVSDTVGTIITDYSYNTVGELTSVNTKRSGATFYNVSYTRDSLGRIAQKLETVEGVTKKHNYIYDLAGRLYQVKRNDTLISAYSYDANGNRLAHITTTQVDSGKYDAQDRLLNYSSVFSSVPLIPKREIQYSYTKAGNLAMKVDTVAGDTTRYTYDALGSLLNVQLPNGDLIEYLIDAKNRRVGKKLNGITVSRWIYNGDLKPVAELDSVGNISARFVYAQKENVPEYVVKAGETYRIVTDHLGSPRLIVNTASGAIVGRKDYDEYGNVTSSYDSLSMPFGFAGGLYDTQTKMVRFGARDYCAESGRWTAKDPILFESNTTNLYEYVGNDPINSIDPKGEFGLASFAYTVGASAAAGYAVGAGMDLVEQAMTDIANISLTQALLSDRAILGAMVGGACGAGAYAAGYQVVAHGGQAWHLGIDAANHMNVIHVGNSLKYGIHVAFGAVAPYAANFHIYLWPRFYTWWPGK